MKENRDRAVELLQKYLKRAGVPLSEVTAVEIAELVDAIIAAAILGSQDKGMDR